MEQLTSVYFLMADGSFRVGDVAGVPEWVAKKLIESSPKKARLARESDLKKQNTQADVASTKGLVSITFTKSQPPYRIGESAGFSEDIAQAYIDANVANLTDDSAVKTAGMSGPTEDRAILDPKVRKALGR